MIAPEILDSLNLNVIAKAQYEAMKNNGFWDDYENAHWRGGGLAEALQRAFISEKLMLIVSELGEAMESRRKGSASPIALGQRELLHLPDENHPENHTPFQQKIKDTFEDELADVFIRLLDLVGALDIDIDFHIREKIRHNASRPRKHGKTC